MRSSAGIRMNSLFLRNMENPCDIHGTKERGMAARFMTD